MPPRRECRPYSVGPRTHARQDHRRAHLRRSSQRQDSLRGGGNGRGGGVLSQGWSGEKVPLKYVPTAYVQIHPFTRPYDSPTRTNPTPNSRATTRSVIRSFDVPSNHRGLTEVPPPIISCRTVACATAPAVTVTQPVPAHGAQTVVHQTDAHCIGPK